MLVFNILVAFAVWYAAGNSRGVGMPCNVDINVGSDASARTNRSTLPSDPIMWWAARPTWAGEKYTLRAGDGAASGDATSYVPNQWTELYLRSHEKHRQVVGLVLYAEDAGGNKVGQWAIPPKAPFHQPADCVVHQNANPKNTLNTFRFSAPAVGTVTIKALVKFGLANPVSNGAFYWPNTQHLTLTQGEAPSEQVWFEGKPAESCDQTCQSVDGACDLEALKAQGQASSMYDKVKAVTTCTLPLMAGCSDSSPSATDEGCFFHDESCTIPTPPPTPAITCDATCSWAQGRSGADGYCCMWKDIYVGGTPSSGCYCLVEGDGVYSEYNGVWSRGPQPGDTQAPTPALPDPEPLSCSSTIDWSSGARRLCACSGATPSKPSTPDGTPTPAPTPTPTPGVIASAATAPAPFRLAWLVALASALTWSPSPSSRLGVALLLGLACLPSAHAHNWLTSPARGNEAGENNGFNGFTSAPCPQRSARIHTQVGTGQKFPVEWAAGHGFGSFTYFAVVKAEDEKHLPKHTLELLDDYLDNAPTPSLSYMADTPVLHVAHQDHGGANCHQGGTCLKPGNVAADYVWVPDDPSTKGERPAGFRNFPTVFVNEKTAEGTANDKRAKYTNAKYPWIIAAHKFTMRYDFPDDADTTQIEIPSEFGSGKFIVQYLWSGYYDCIDVNVLSVPSTDLWGKAGATGQGDVYDRVDHCQFIEDYPGFALLGAQCKGISETDTIKACEALCGADCQAIQVTQSALDKRVVDSGVWAGTEHLQDACVASAATNPFVCFGVTEGAPQVGPTYRISADPEDPVFYNSCFRKTVGWTFDQMCDTCIPTKLEPGWIFGNECISCNEMSANVQQDGYIPKWDFQPDPEQCRHCNNLG